MKVIIVLLLLNVAFCLQTFAQEIQQEEFKNSTGEYGWGNVNINNQVDQNLDIVSAYMVSSGLDPIRLPSLNQNFEVKGLIIKHNGTIKLRRGWLQDLRTIERDGDAILSIRLTKWHFKIPLGFFNIEFGYDYHVKLNRLIGRSGGIMGNVKDLQMFVNAVFDVRKRHVDLKQCDVTDIGKINVLLTGKPWNDWWMNAFVGEVTNMIHDQIVTSVNATVNVLAQYIVNAINKNIPFDLKNLDNLRID